MSDDETEANGQPAAEPSQKSRRRYVWRIVAAAVVVLLGLCLMPNVGEFSWLIEWPGTLLFGWIPYGLQVIWLAASHGTAIALWGIGLGLFISGLHYGARKFSADWQVRQTVAVVTLILAAATAGISLIGVGHQAIWLAHAPQVIDTGKRQFIQHQDSEMDLQSMTIGVVSFAKERDDALPRSTFSKTGRPLHSWMTMLLPHVGRMDLYGRVILEGPWDMNYQDPVFDTPVNAYSRLGAEVERDERGFAVSHYSANSRVIDAHGVKRLEEVQDGMANTILFGEINDQFPAWGRPRNGRDPAIGLNRPGGFSSPYNSGAQFVMGDGSVKHLSRDIDPEVLRALSTPQGNEPASQYKAP